MNVGTGKPSSVKEIVRKMSGLVGKEIPCQIVNRRKGDVAVSYASPKKIEEKTGWKSSYDIAEAIKSSLDWQTKNPKGYSL